MLVKLWLLQVLRHNYRQKNVHDNALKRTGVATHLSFFSFSNFLQGGILFLCVQQ